MLECEMQTHSFTTTLSELFCASENDLGFGLDSYKNFEARR